MNKTEDIKLNEVLSVYDGDTFRGRVNAWPPFFGENMGFRLYGVDTPERGWRAKSDLEREHAEKAREFTRKMLTEAKKVVFDVIKYDRNGGRIVAKARCDGKDISEALIENKLAVEYYGKGPKVNWAEWIIEMGLDK